jgi:hypothetical protein
LHYCTTLLSDVDFTHAIHEFGELRARLRTREGAP